MQNILETRYLRIVLALVLSLLYLVSCSNLPGQTLSIPSPTKPLTTLPPSTPTFHSPTATTTEATPTSIQNPEPGEAGVAETPPTPLPNAPSIPDASTITWKLVAEGLEQPTSLANAGDGSGRVFILEKAGLVRVLKDGQLEQEPYLDLRDRVRTQGYTTAGLLGMTFHPEFIENGFFYVNYTASNGNTTISRFSALPDLSRGEPDSEMVLLEIPQPVGEHRGGDMAFGPDGYLYISIGDGGGAGFGDPEGNAQNPESLLGKILRLDVDSLEPYAIPADNPFAVEGGRPEVWAYGLRNPWRFTFDPPTGDLYIADVGENTWEEVNFLPSGTPGGVNFGWNYFEGTEPFQGKPPEALSFTQPVSQYDHTQGCSITGGVVYRGQAMPQWNGVYIYGDYCQGNIWGLLHKPDGSWESQWLVKLTAFIVAFSVDEKGEIYLADITGKIYQLVNSTE